MAAILIRDVAEELHRWLKVEAAMASRTLEEECRLRLTLEMQRSKYGPFEHPPAPLPPERSFVPVAEPTLPPVDKLVAENSGEVPRIKDFDRLAAWQSAAVAWAGADAERMKQVREEYEKHAGAEFRMERR